MFVSVCEDNNIEMDGFLKAFKKLQCISCVDTFNNPKTLISSIKDTRYDIVFLDIFLPYMNGIDAAKKIRKIDPDVNIVFITGAADFSLEAFSIYATDYILKPLSYERLERTVMRIMEKSGISTEKIVDIKTQNAAYRLKESEIILIEKVINHCIVYTEKYTFDVLSPLKYFEGILDKDIFIRSHAGYLVNRHKISKIDVNGNLSYTLHFFGIEKTALVSRGKKNNLFSSIANGKSQNGDYIAFRNK